MSEYIKRELSIGSTAFYEYAQGQLLTTFGGAGTSRQTRYRYTGNGIFCPQSIAVVGFNPTNWTAVTAFNSFTYQIEDDNGKLLTPRQFVNQPARLNLNYDNFDHVRPLTNNDGLVITVFSNTGTSIAYYVVIQGMVYLE